MTADTVGLCSGTAGTQFKGTASGADHCPVGPWSAMRRPPPLALAYHGIADVSFRDDTLQLFTHPRVLARHVSILRRWGYRLVTFGDLARKATTGQADGLAALTFDDGFSDNLHNLVPVLREKGAVATVFVISGLLGCPHPDVPQARLLDPDELRALADAGVEIGSHSASHADLSKMSYVEALEEMRGSRHQLEELIGRPVTVAAYPFGRTSETAARACRDAGFAGVARVVGELSWTDPWNVPRQAMSHGSGVFGLWLKREDRYEAAMRLPLSHSLRGGLRRVKGLVS